MKKLILPTLAFMLFFLSSCSAIEGIFKAGLYVGIFAIIAILVIIVFIYMKVRK
jgi:uncharacterized membrane protein